ncbi:ATP-binding cassette domain-containing protein [Rothia sp. P5766]|uniref:ATP-binding cassette domain-containing protein n=1 Tax=unclassified Rothia (in: high G+C Gram-positive bacteria) TaxID=2689056 RepID=UPI003AC924FE
MNTIARTQNLSKTFRGTKALDGINLEIEEGLIYGLAGRNGAGKTTLLTALTGQTLPDKGSQIELFGQSLNATTIARTHLQRTNQSYPDDLRVFQVLKMGRLAHPNWDQSLALSLLLDFEIPFKARARRLSDGQKSALGIAVALASRADLTLMDEPYTGLDPVARALFYDRLLEDFSAHPRTFIISTHLLDEISPLLNRVILIDRGELVFTGDAEDATYTAHEVAGNQDAVSVYLAKTSLEGFVVRDRAIGSMRSLVVAAALTAENEELAGKLGVGVQPVSLQDTVAAHSRKNTDQITQGELS